jgi:hypothetical protein
LRNTLTSRLLNDIQLTGLNARLRLIELYIKVNPNNPCSGLQDERNATQPGSICLRMNRQDLPALPVEAREASVDQYHVIDYIEDIGFY